MHDLHKSPIKISDGCSITLDAKVAASFSAASAAKTMEVERVQKIASIVTDIIPEEFIRSEKERPSTTTYHGPVPGVPIVDFAEPDKNKVDRAVAEAAREWGIFQVVNHGIPMEVIQKLQKVGKEFFELPQEQKEAYAIKPGSKSLEGYGTKLQKDLEGKKAWVDFLFHNVWPPSCINYDVWPRNPSAYRPANEEYAQHLRGLVDRILHSLSVELGLVGGMLKAAVGGDELEYLLKINYYPPCPRPDLVLGLVAHTDLSALTILLPNDVPGLQVFMDDHWFDVKYVPGGLVVHVGDQVEILSNGYYKSVLHRTTVSKEKARMSWPVFCSPPGEMVVGPLAELISEENPAKFKAKQFKDYQYCKLNKLPQ